MMLLLQVILYCLLYFLLVKIVVKNNGMNCIYFYPKEYQEKAIEFGMTDREIIQKKAKAFMIPFLIIITLALVAIVAFWNRVTDYWEAYLQVSILLVAMNWFDGIIMDGIWVGKSKIWIIPGMEGYSYRKSWKEIFVKRSIATVLFLIIAFALAGIVVLLGNR